MTADNLDSILDKIAQNEHTDADIQTLRQAINSGDRQTKTQLAKYIVNIGEGKELQIGDRIYQKLDDEAIQALVQAIQNNKPKKVFSQFQSLIEDKTTDFVGRDYVFQAIDKFIDDNPKGYFTITGDPGQGKSAILAKYVQNTRCIAHFNILLQHGNIGFVRRSAACS